MSYLDLAILSYVVPNKEAAHQSEMRRVRLATMTEAIQEPRRSSPLPGQFFFWLLLYPGRPPWFLSIVFPEPARAQDLLDWSRVRHNSDDTSWCRRNVGLAALDPSYRRSLGSLLDCTP